MGLERPQSVKRPTHVTTQTLSELGTNRGRMTTLPVVIFPCKFDIV